MPAHARMHDTLMTAADAANRLRCTPRTIVAMIRRGELAAVKLPCGWRIDPADLDYTIASYAHASRQTTHTPTHSRIARQTASGLRKYGIQTQGARHEN